jgi:hypothetical protein
MELITQPTFRFPQKDGDEIRVEYYSTSLLIHQGDDTVEIDYDNMNALFKEIKKHLPEALKHMK